MLLMLKWSTNTYLNPKTESDLLNNDRFFYVPTFPGRPWKLASIVKTWIRLKNDRHSVPVVVGGLIGRAGICCVVEQKLLSSLKTVEVF